MTIYCVIITISNQKHYVSTYKHLKKKKKKSELKVSNQCQYI